MAKRTQDGGGVFLLLGGALALFALSKGGGGGGGGSIPGGTLSAITVEQARMGVHLKPKTAGALLTVTVNWTPNTTLNGLPVLWPYSFDYELVLLPARTTMQSGFLGQSTADVGARSTQFPVTLGGVPAGNYSLGVEMFAPAADVNGQPTGALVRLGQVGHSNAISVT